VSDTSTSGTGPALEPPPEQPAETADAGAFPPERSSWIGWIIFAALMLVLLGVFQLTAGFVAVLDEDYFQSTGAAPLFLAVDQQTWGVLQLVLGSLAILTGAGLLRGNPAARVVGAAIVLLGAILNLMAIGAYPLWSTLLIAVDVCILYAITVHGREMRPAG
jgi:hypothetical protein